MPAAPLRYVRHYFANGNPSPQSPRDADGHLNEILTLLLHAGQDYRGYRRPAVRRRVECRMGLRHIDDLPDHLTFPREHPQEVRQLAGDLLIGVTSFVREPEASRARRWNRPASSASPTVPGPSCAASAHDDRSPVPSRDRAEVARLRRGAGAMELRPAIQDFQEFYESRPNLARRLQCF